MHAVVNKLTLSKPIDDQLLQRLAEQFYPQLRDERRALRGLSSRELGWPTG